MRYTYVVKNGKTYLPKEGRLSAETLAGADKFGTRGAALDALAGSNILWRENGRIVRLKPKPKPAMIPVPTVAQNHKLVCINGREVFFFAERADAERLASNLRECLGTPPPSKSEPTVEMHIAPDYRPQGMISIVVNGMTVAAYGQSEAHLATAKAVTHNLREALGLLPVTT